MRCDGVFGILELRVLTPQKCLAPLVHITTEESSIPTKRDELRPVLSRPKRGAHTRSDE